MGSFCPFFTYSGLPLNVACALLEFFDVTEGNLELLSTFKTCSLCACLAQSGAVGSNQLPGAARGCWGNRSVEGPGLKRGTLGAVLVERVSSVCFPAGRFIPGTEPSI